MINIIAIQFYFCDLCNSCQRSENESLVRKTIEAYRQEGIDLEKKGKLLFFFAFKGQSITYRDELGALIAKKSPEYAGFKREYAGEIVKIKDFKSFENVILLSGIIWKEKTDIPKILTIAHECHHIVQDQDVENYLLKDIGLKKYLKLKFGKSNQFYSQLYINILMRNIPSEFDAFRESKRKAFQIIGEEKVNKFLDDNVEEHRRRFIHTDFFTNVSAKEATSLTYWEHMKAVNIEDNFDFERESNDVWSKYRILIEKKIDEIQRKRKEERDEDECDLEEAYKYFNSSS